MEPSSCGGIGIQGRTTVYGFDLKSSGTVSGMEKTRGSQGFQLNSQVHQNVPDTRY